MDSAERESWGAAYALLEDLLDLPAGEREAAVARGSGSPEIAAKVRRLLAAAAAQHGILDAPAPWLGEIDAALPGVLAGARFGPYEVVDEIGRGGMSVVFRARRADGQFERDVALKLLTMGQLALGSAERLRHEQAMLARLEHPGIATLHDGGVAADGTPWLAMELVDGEPIDTWCANQGLDARAIVGLFLQVGDAVAFAHRNLVVHRDLKPGNILVDRDGRVRLLDFGIAKLLDEGAPDATATRVLTPGYGAPEQITGGAVTTATDVYAMGAVLYRLLTGTPPFEGRQRLAAAETGAVEIPPPAPSTLAGHLRGADADLDNAVLMAMRPETARRYTTAEALSDDLRRWLDGRPLKATPDSLGYRLGKHARRHRGAVAASVLAAAGLLAGTSLAVWQARVAGEESRLARAAAADASRQLRRAEEVTRFLVDTFAAADPLATRGKDVTADEIVDQGAQRIDRELRGQPTVRRQVLSVLGEISYRLGDLERAEELLAQCLAIGGIAAGERVHDLRLAAVAASARGDYSTAELRFAEGLALATSAGLPTADRAQLELDLAVHLSDSEQNERAEANLRRLLASPWLSQAGEVVRGKATISLAQVLAGEGRYAEAREAAAQALTLLSRQRGERDVELAAARSISANVEANLGRLEAAERLERRALETYLAVYGRRHHRTLQAQNDLATYLKNRGRFRDSAELLEEVLAAQRAALGADHPYVAATWFNLGEARLLAGEVPAALAAYRRAVEMAEANPSGLAARRGIFHVIYGRAVGKAGDAVHAEAELERGTRILIASPGPSHPMTARAAVEYAGFLNDRGRRAEALRRLEPVLPLLASAYGERSRELALARLQLGRALWPASRAAARLALAQARDGLASSPFKGRYGAEIDQASRLLAGG
jgi:eukaryotic-like serine/threonine-protein kinase